MTRTNAGPRLRGRVRASAAAVVLVAALALGQPVAAGVPSPGIVPPTAGAGPALTPSPTNPWPMVTVVDTSRRALSAVIDFTVCTKVTGPAGQQCVTASTVLDDNQRTIGGVSDLIARTTVLPAGAYTTITVEVSVKRVPVGYEPPTRTYTAVLNPNNAGVGWRENDQGQADGVLTFVVEGQAADPGTTSPPVTQPPGTNPPVTSPPVTSPPISAPPGISPPRTSPALTAPPVIVPPVTAPTVPRTPGDVPGRASGTTSHDPVAAPTPEGGPLSEGPLEQGGQPVLTHAPSAATAGPSTSASTTPAADTPAPVTPPPTPQPDPGSFPGLDNTPLTPILGGGIVIAGLLLAFAPPLQRPRIR